MTHEPECVELDQPPYGTWWCICDRLRAAYRRGYNDHARSVQHWQDTHGAYRHCADATCWCNRDDIRVAMYQPDSGGTT